MLGTADDSTISGAVTAARAASKGVVVDLINVPNKAVRAMEGHALGAVFVAGGVSASTIAAVQNSGAQIAVAGSAIYSAEDPAAAAASLRALISRP
ncbi:hypothetical protein [Streptomyces antioxidans]|uniref:hypothetical protein n=1 Tax=Streptomyces antioxidans TaxID=1507734 RepID=UPI000AE6CFDF|nr:hypothetical protein [Streptomyces antioxidans]